MPVLKSLQNQSKMILLTVGGPSPLVDVVTSPGKTSYTTAEVVRTEIQSNDLG